ncbi:MAG: hypothetical protein R3E42_07100 [Burkholderiaceae bacterium]
MNTSPMAINTEAQAQRVAWVVLAVGVSAALHIGKLPVAIPVLREALGVSLVQAGFCFPWCNSPACRWDCWLGRGPTGSVRGV